MNNKNIIKVAVAGFVFGIIVLPFITVLGLGIPYLEYLKPLLSPGLSVAQLFIVQVDANTSYVPMFGWIAFSITNGVFYSLIFTAVHYVRKKHLGRVSGHSEDNS